MAKDLSSVGFSELNLEAMRTRLQKMSDSGEPQNPCARRTLTLASRRVRHLSFNLRRRGQS